MTPGRCCRALRAAMFAATCVLLASLGHVLMSGRAVPWWAVAPAVAVTGALAWALADRERGLFAVTSATVAVQAALHAGFSLAQAVAGHSATAAGGGSLARRWARYLLCGPADAAAPPPSEAVRVVAGGGPGGALPSPPPTAGHAHHVASAASSAHASHASHAVHAMPDGGAGAGDLAASATATASTSTLASVPMPAGHDMGGMSPTGMLAAHLLAALLCGLWLAYGEQGAFRVLRALAGLLLVPLRPLLRLPTPPDRPRLRARRDRRRRSMRGLLIVHAITSRGPPPGTAVI
ncbi:hypothetical protein [Streptomyces sp. NPDC048606]|uniref:hypothetical protein n=1 Tax=Streptomyces sp. NPDC048606 TaxID=3154726 RepID=UPI003429C969